MRTFAKSELVRAMSFVAIPGLIGPMLGPIAGGLIVGYFHWRLIFFVNIPIGLVGTVHGLSALAGLSRAYGSSGRGRADSFGSGVALLSYVLEVFGEHTLSRREMLGLLALSHSCCWRATDFTPRRTAYPLLRLALFRIRTFRAAVSGSFVTRLGIGGIPFLFPLAVPGGTRIHADSVRAC